MYVLHNISRNYNEGQLEDLTSKYSYRCMQCDLLSTYLAKGAQNQYLLQWSLDKLNQLGQQN